MRQFRYAQAGCSGTSRYSPPLQHQWAAVRQDSDECAPQSSLLVEVFWFLVNVAGAIVGALIGLVIGILFFWVLLWIVFRGELRQEK
jgi:hypothetical protein